MSTLIDANELLHRTIKEIAKQQQIMTTLKEELKKHIETDSIYEFLYWSSSKVVLIEFNLKKLNLIKENLDNLLLKHSDYVNEKYPTLFNNIKSRFNEELMRYNHSHDQFDESKVKSLFFINNFLANSFI